MTRRSTSILSISNRERCFSLQRAFSNSFLERVGRTFQSVQNSSSDFSLCSGKKSEAFVLPDFLILAVPGSHPRMADFLLPISLASARVASHSSCSVPLPLPKTFCGEVSIRWSSKAALQKQHIARSLLGDASSL